MNIKYILEQVKFHAGIVLKGFARTIYGALVAGLLAIAIYGFISIRSEAGYIAVFDFIAACATLTVAVCNLYVMGGKRKRGKA